MSGIGWAVSGAGGDDGPILLRRDGHPPLRFAGALIARSPTSPTAAGVTYDLAIYRRAGGGFATHIVALWTDRHGTAPSRCHAALFDTLDPALSWLESHDPTQDICPGLAVPTLHPEDADSSALASLIDASILRAAGHETARRYRVAAGQTLMAVARAALS